MSDTDDKTAIRWAGAMLALSIVQPDDRIAGVVEGP
jgi:hypothetical protein